MDKKLKRVISEFTKGILDKNKPEGMCFAVGCALSGYLNFLGYDNDIIEGEIIINEDSYEHYWIKYGELIIDPTASQFNNRNGKKMPKIYIGKKPNHYKQLK